MDTMGLAPFGLPDLQIHARGLVTGRLTGHLYNCAYYIDQRGACIQDGQTSERLTNDQRWQC
jgi:hypothetical protein